MIRAALVCLALAAVFFARGLCRSRKARDARDFELHEHEIYMCTISGWSTAVLGICLAVAALIGGAL